MKNNLPYLFHIKKAGLFILLFLFTFTGFSQSRKLDSLNNLLKTSKDTVRVQILGKIFGYYYLTSRFEEALKCSEQIRDEISRSSLPPDMKDNWMSNAVSNAGSCYSAISDYRKAREFHLKALSLREKTHDKRGIANSYNNIGNTYWFQGDYEPALKYYMNSLKIREEIGDKNGIAGCYGNIGLIYKAEGLLDKALVNQLAAINLYKELKNENGLNGALNNFANCLKDKANESANFNEKIELYDKALDNYSVSIQISEKLGDEQQIALCFGNIGSININKAELPEFKDKKNELIKKALEFHFKGLEIWERLKIKRGIALANNNIGTDYLMIGKYNESEPYLMKSLSLGREIGDRENVKMSLEKLSELFAEKKDYKQAFFYSQQFQKLKDSLSNEKIRKQISEMNERHEGDRKDKEIQLLNKDKETQLIEHKRQNAIIIAVSVVLILVMVFAFFVFRGYRQKKEANLIITAQKEDAEKKTILIEEQKHLVEEKNKDITDSINYAKKIQEAILPAKEVKYSIFPNGFVLFQPRDIVSGDFYWFTSKNNKRIITAVDCTGHGVPGAFMSMIGNTFLNEIVEERGITKPSEILSELRHMVIKSLKQEEEESKSRDGMDMALIVIDDEKKMLEYAGANNPLWIIRNGNCMEFTADKRPIGYYRGKGLPFTNHEIPLEKGDSIYVFTDGYADQFGGPKGKKFKYKQFMELLISIQRTPMLNQEKTLLDKFNAWKGDLDQVDDVLVIGIRI